MKFPMSGSCEEDEPLELPKFDFLRRMSTEPLKLPVFGISRDNTPGITLGQSPADTDAPTLISKSFQVSGVKSGPIPAKRIPLFSALPGFPVQSCTEGHKSPRAVQLLPLNVL